LTEASSFLILLGLAALVAAVADEAARQVDRRTGWRAAAPYLLLAATPLVPNEPVLLGFSLDDVLPLFAVGLMLPLVPWRRIREYRWQPSPGTTIACIGVVTMIAAALLSAFLNAGDPFELGRLIVRGAGRLAFLVLIVVAVAILGSTERSRTFSAYAIAGVGTFEAAFGLVAYFVGLPLNAGLEMARGASVLVGTVPGRISGTIGTSPNFIGAILMMSILVTAGLALRAPTSRNRWWWWAAVVVQLGALTLTYTRVSLGLVVIALVVLVLLRSRPILLAPVGGLLVLVAIFTPTLSRFASDIPDRLALWTSAFLLMIDNPIAGVGPGGMLEAVAANPERYRVTAFGQALSTAHNTVLLAGAETGFIGAVGAIILNLGLAVIVIQVFRRAPKGAAGSLQVAAALGLGIFLAQGMVNNLFTVGVTGICAAFLLGTQLLEARLPEGAVEAAGTVAFSPARVDAGAGVGPPGPRAVEDPAVLAHEV
jgi:O-antigen ligase